MDRTKHTVASRIHFFFPKINNIRADKHFQAPKVRSNQSMFILGLQKAAKWLQIQKFVPLTTVTFLVKQIIPLIHRGFRLTDERTTLALKCCEYRASIRKGTCGRRKLNKGLQFHFTWIILERKRASRGIILDSRSFLITFMPPGCPLP